MGDAEKRNGADCEGGPEVRSLSQLARKKSKKKTPYRHGKYARVRMGLCSRTQEVMVPFMVSESAVAFNEE